MTRITPARYDPGEIITAITRQPEVVSVHGVHVWLITALVGALSRRRQHPGFGAAMTGAVEPLLAS
jgi:Co/Zn/Cd efflux system component